MNSSPFSLILLLTVSGLTPFALAAQDRTSSGTAAGVAELRTIKAAARQTKALAAMTTSIAGQRLSVERQLQNLHTSEFPGFEVARGPDPVLTVPSCDSLPSSEIDNLVDMAAARTSVSPELIRSVMRQESAFRACAVSARGAMGLMQLLPETAAGLGVANAFDPEANVLGGATLLRQLMDRYGGDLSLTLSAYNAGPRKVDASMGVPMIPETIDYVTKVLLHLPLARSVQSLENAETDDQSGRDSAPAMSFRLTEMAGAE